jgi:hypothetical protein
MNFVNTSSEMIIWALFIKIRCGRGMYQLSNPAELLMKEGCI